ncbi:MAG: hypothetical protein ILA26_00065 [Methanobrevibacter sp.]|uniref:hypothetical protein n=1 Tax=Methanobrevibacter sp. TaxID=66852 RepID=UPI001B661714|nr:hypothetical protein [Methanobrevibacter sp.]MBP3790410.1 hypothetical protein [Methanobrevibacter sp.]
MILKDLLNHFEIEEDLPDYLLSQPFNEVFMDGEVTLKDDSYEIVVTTRQDVTHQMFIRPNDEFPVIIMSELPNGLLNGMKFPQEEHVGIPINKL